MIFLWRDFFRRKTGEMYRAPEAIASSDEVMTCHGCRHGRVDAAEQHIKMFSDDVLEFVGHRSSLSTLVGDLMQLAAYRAHDFLREFSQLIPRTAGAGADGHAMHGGRGEHGQRFRIGILIQFPSI